MKTSLLLTALLLSTPVLACQFDTDCQPGNRCVKSMGALNGVCQGGMNPGNVYDKKPVTSPTDPNKTYGNTCTFDTDCGPSSECKKENGNMKGVCLKR